MSDKTNLIAAVSILLVLLATAAVYWPGLNGPFLLDDYVNIVSAYVSDFTFDDLYYAATHNTSGTLGRPVSVLSLAISGVLHGPEPWGYKFHNLIIHLINGLLIFWLLYKLLPRLAPRQSEEKNLLVAGLTAGIWLLHPLMVSTVLYAVQRMAQLSSLFTLAALLVYLYARESAPDSRKNFYWLGYVAFPLMLLLAIFSKENGALIPVYIIALELIVFRFAFTSRRERNRLYCLLAVFVLIPVSVGSLYMLTHFGQFTNYSLRDFTMGERLMTELQVVVVYLKMILLPRLSDMTLFHDYFQVTRRFDLVTGILLLLFVFACTMVFYLRTRAPVAAFAIAWFIVSHLLESTFFSLELMFEHRNYLAAVGPLFAVVYYLFNIRNYPQLKYLNVVMLMLVVFLTMTRVQEWRSRELIYQVALSEHPDSYRVHTEMATVLYRAGNLNEALQHLDAAKELRKTDFGPVLHQAAFSCSSGADLTPLIDEAVFRASNYPVTVYSLNASDNLVGLLNDGVCPEISFDMLLSVVQAAERQEDNLTSEKYLGFLEKIEGQINLYQGNYQKGMGLLLSAFERTGMVRILANMADILLYVGRLDEAEQIINYMAVINDESRGTETALLAPLQEKLATARAEVQGE